MDSTNSTNLGGSDVFSEDSQSEEDYDDELDDCDNGSGSDSDCYIYYDAQLATLHSFPQQQAMTTPVSAQPADLASSSTSHTMPSSSALPVPLADSTPTSAFHPYHIQHRQAEEEGQH